VRRLLFGGSPVQGRYPASEVNNGPCPEKPVHLRPPHHTSFINEIEFKTEPACPILSITSLSKSALIVDRDDTIVVDSGYMSGDDEIVFVSGALDLLASVSAMGNPIFIATNQSGVARGMFALNDMHRFNARLMRSLQSYNINVQDIVFCPHHPRDKCICRKPMPGLLYQLRNRHGISLESSVVIGDKESDKILGKTYCRNGFQINKHGITVSIATKILSELNHR